MTKEPENHDATGRPDWKPVLGLSDEAPAPADFAARAGTVFDQPEPEQLLELTVIIPARNEEDCIGACLKSLVSQSEDVFELGRDWELILVDDGSSDRTAEIARSFGGVTVITAPSLEKGWTGKANAIWTAARKARGKWLLFTDADTIHEPGDLHRGIHEAARHKAGMLSYSPRQIVSGFVRMYRSTPAMIDGWTKNLALLFHNALSLSVWRALDFFLLFGLPVLALELWNAHFAQHSIAWLGAGWVLAVLWLRNLVRFYARVAKSNFPFVDCAIAPLGLPLFVFLLYRSWFQHKMLKRVSWKGREYAQ